MEHNKVLEIIIKALPYSNQIKNINLDEVGVVRFSWRQAKYRVSGDLFVEECKNGCLVGSDITILMEKLLEIASVT